MIFIQIQKIFVVLMYKSDTTCSKGQKEDFLLQNNLQKIHIYKLAKKTFMYMLLTFFIKQTPTFCLF